MGVDIQAYRCRIGTFAGHLGRDVITLQQSWAFTRSFKTIGTVIFIGILLIMAGIEVNPGPNEKDEVKTNHTDVTNEVSGISAGNPGLDEVKTNHTDVTNEVSGISAGNPGLEEVKTNHADVTNEVSGRSASNPGLEPGLSWMLTKYNMTRWFKEKITLRIASRIASSMKQDRSLKLEDRPWALLEHLMCVNNKARDNFAPKASSLDDYDWLNDDIRVSDPESNMCALDLLLTVIHCSNPVLKVVLYQKMYLCKIAVPFMYSELQNTPKLILKWPLRSLRIENTKLDNHKTIEKLETNALNLKSHFVIVARLGRPSFSKSTLLNNLLSDQTSATFFNRDCPSGSNKRVICKGYVEAFWLPLHRESIYSDAITFLNARGNLEHDFTFDEVKTFSKLTDILVLVIDSASIPYKMNFMARIFELFKRIVVLFYKPSSPSDTETQRIRSIIATFKNVQIIPTCKHNNELNAADIKERVTKSLIEIKDFNPIPLEQRLEQLEKSDVKESLTIDENSSELRVSKGQATVLFSILKTKDPKDWKKTFTPIQFELSPKLAKYLKTCARSKDSEQIKKDIRKTREECRNKITDFIIVFINKLVLLDIDSVQLTLFWLGYLIDNTMEDVLPKYIYEKDLAWKRLHESRRNNSLRSVEKQRDIDFRTTTKHLEDMSFGLQHILREIYHIYENFICIKLNPEDLWLPSVDKVSTLFVNLFIEGFPLEVMSGDYCFVARNWTNEVFRKIDQSIEQKKVLVLSILGLQSSGKSTLLNTMFGSNFAVSAGRCTRGVHVRLFELKKGFRANYSYVLVVDTEGLRASELGNDSYNHDNEMSTFATGLGDIALLNIMGESISEIDDILQIVVHAFLRLQNANRNMKMKQSCLFLHQNVAATDATSKMSHGFQKLLNKLDKITKEAAASEGYIDIRAFDQVINIDQENSVWYFPNLWLGTPPNASVSYRYSSKAMQLKSNILKKAGSSKHNTMVDISTKVLDLYNGILAENFVFSFRNNLEIKAHVSLEKNIKDLQRNIEREMNEHLRSSLNIAFSKVETIVEISEAEKSLKTSIHQRITLRSKQAIDDLENIFENSEYPEIIEHWKSSKTIALEYFFGELDKSLMDEIKRIKEKREIVVKASQFYAENEKELNYRSKELARRLRGKTNCNIDLEFEQLWVGFVCKLPQEPQRATMKQFFIDATWEVFTKECQFFKEHFENWSPKLDDISLSLEDSCKHLDITKEDISVYKSTNLDQFICRLLEFIKVKDSDVKRAKQQVKLLYKSLNDTLNCHMKSDCEIQSYKIKDLLQHILEWKMDMESKSEHNCFAFKPSGIVKIVLHAGQYVVILLQQHNDNYQQCHGIKAELQKLRNVAKLKLAAMIESRKTEETCAKVLTERVREFLLDEINDKKSFECLNFLRSVIPQVKHTLIVEILISLINANSFESFMYYIKHPYQYAKRWISEKAENILFKRNSGQYNIIIGKMVQEGVRKFREALDEIGDVQDMKTWVQRYNDCLGKKRISIPTEVIFFFENNVQEIKNTQINNFIGNLKELFSDMESELLTYFGKENAENVKWASFNVYHKMADDIWGCDEACVFCKEPCYKSKAHSSPECHSCIQHRPQCCTGIRYMYSQQSCIECCNMDVASDRRHTCGCFEFLCNDSKESCVEGFHRYSEYAKFVKNWNIEGNNDPEMVSKYWMRFVWKYKEDLKELYNYKIDNIPESWSYITDKDAIESIRMIYKG